MVDDRRERSLAVELFTIMLGGVELRVRYSYGSRGENGRNELEPVSSKDLAGPQP
jgi:hypothetical protein